MSWRKKTIDDPTLGLEEGAWVIAQQRLAILPGWARHRGVILYAAAPAERLMRVHDQRPESERRTYSESWRPVLDSVWDYCSGDEAAFEPISRAMGQYLLSPQSHNRGQEGPDDADQDEVAATIFAASAVLHGLVDFALLAAARATDAIDNRWYGIDESRRVDEIKAEVAQQRHAMTLIDQAAADRQRWSPGASADLIAELRG